MHTQDVSNPQQRRDARIDAAGLHVLIRLPAHPRGEEHMLLGAVLAEPFDADTVTDGLSALKEPGVVVRQSGHPLET